MKSSLPVGVPPTSAGTGATPSERTRGRGDARAAAALLVAVLSSLVFACGDDTTPPSCSDSCADQDPCTVDRCIDGECVSEPAPAGLDCSDGDACNGSETCDGQGRCAGGEPVPIADGDSCTLDVCDPATGQVAHAFEAGCVTWRPVTTTAAPIGRTRHTAVWTGSKMIVWGGQIEADPGVTASGAAYDPATDSWAPISEVGAPSARHSHQAVWTGSKMIVWGGFSTTFENSGAIYDPASDSWTPMTLAGAPAGRVSFSSTWQDDRLVIHGGQQGQAVYSDTSTYDPATDTWAAVTAAGGPSPRFGHSAVVDANGEMIVWGGTDLFDWLKTGATLSAGAWTTMPVPEIASRSQHGAVWSGSEMIVWGGFDGGVYAGDGAIYEPATGWLTTTASAGAPEGRAEHVMLWTEVSAFVWGGCGGQQCQEAFGDGALFTPTELGGSWGKLPSAGAPTARHGATGVWTGREVVVWGGREKSGAYASSGAIATLVPL